MGLIAIKVGRFDFETIDHSDVREIFKGSGVDLIDYEPGHHEAILVCESNGKSPDDIILAILEAGYMVKRYYLTEKHYN
ncbi:MAG: hypothetical protein ACOY30_10735 [Bacillota bacterium]